MGNKDQKPMFDIENSENITLIGNQSSSETLLKAKDIKKLEAIDNFAGKKINNSTGFIGFILKHLFKVVVSTMGIILTAMITYYVNHYLDTN